MAVQYSSAVGRRKESSARVKLEPGKGEVTVNNKTGIDYFGNSRLLDKVIAPLKALSLETKYNVFIKVVGGGKNGQAEAARHGVARALVKEDEGHKSVLRKLGYITRDPRAKERKKPGYKGARKKPQFSKR